MTTFSENWNAAYEALPADSEDLGDGADRIRDFKKAFRERLNVDHYLDPAGTLADHGEHRQCTLRELAADPTAVANKGFIYTKDDGGDTELYYEDDSGNVVKLTADGALATTSAFAAGTKMLFYQDTAPAGWTLQNTLDDKLVFVTKGSVAGGQTGGAVHASGAWTITGISMAAHTHSVGNSAYQPLAYQVTGPEYGPPTVTGSASPAVTADGTWRPAAYSCIICSKD